MIKPTAESVSKRFLNFLASIEFADMGLVPADAHKNREFREPVVDFFSPLDRVFRNILFDPETSSLFWQGVPPEETYGHGPASKRDRFHPIYQEQTGGF
jgi:hypothetical protein